MTPRFDPGSHTLLFHISISLDFVKLFVKTGELCASSTARKGLRQYEMSQKYQNALEERLSR